MVRMISRGPVVGGFEERAEGDVEKAEGDGGREVGLAGGPGMDVTTICRNRRASMRAHTSRDTPRSEIRQGGEAKSRMRSRRCGNELAQSDMV